MQGRGFHYSTRGAIENKFCDAQPVDSAGPPNRRKTYPLCDNKPIEIIGATGGRRSPRRGKPLPSVSARACLGQFSEASRKTTSASLKRPQQSHPSDETPDEPSFAAPVPLALF